MYSFSNKYMHTNNDIVVEPLLGSPRKNSIVQYGASITCNKIAVELDQ